MEIEGLLQCLIKCRDHLKQGSAAHAARRSGTHELNHDSSIQYIKSCCSVSVPSEYEEFDAHMPQAQVPSHEATSLNIFTPAD